MFCKLFKSVLKLAKIHSVGNNNCLFVLVHVQTYYNFAKDNKA